MEQTPDAVDAPLLDYLSEAWLVALDEAVRADDALAEATVGSHLVIEQVVELDAPPGAAGSAGAAGAAGAPEGSSAQDGGTHRVTWQVRLVDGAPSVVIGSPEPPTIRFTTDLATAEAITRGREPAQAAFLRGDLRIGGDTATLAERRELLASVADVAASLRGRTRFPSERSEA